MYSINLESLMIEVLHTNRKSAVLTPSSLACLAKMPTVNLTAGCAHGCLYCYTRGYRCYPGEGKVQLYVDTLEKLREELSRKQNKPRAVYFSPSSDLFQPVPELLAMAREILEFLFACGVGVAFLTKGRIPQRHMELIAANAPAVRGQIGVTTLDEKLLRAFEPRAAPPAVRLAQARQLVEAGVATDVRLDPILPGLTDSPETLHPLFAAIADAGVKRVAASVLFLRPAIVHALKTKIGAKEIADSLLNGFSGKGRMAIHAGNSSVLALAVEDRRETFETVVAVARDYGIRVRICTCKNPDLAIGTCNLAGDWPHPSTEAVQRNLFAHRQD